MMPAVEGVRAPRPHERPDTDDFSTLAGFVIFQLGRIPAAGDGFERSGWRFEVVDMDGRRVDKILAERVEA